MAEEISQESQEITPQQLSEEIVSQIADQLERRDASNAVISHDIIERIKTRKLDTIRAAIDILKENNKSKVLNDRNITSDDVLNLASSLDNFIEN